MLIKNDPVPYVTDEAETEKRKREVLSDYYAAFTEMLDSRAEEVKGE